MSDRELLEKAAKAAGVSFVWRSGVGPWIGEYYSGRPWNPLTDDGDALRLAVALNLSVQVHSDISQPLLWLRVVDRDGRWTHAGPGGFHEEDRAASTRRAIVRAAAVIGGGE